MGINTYLKDFCDSYGYTGDFGYDEEKKEYHIIISKDDDNAGAFLSKEELQELNYFQLIDLLNILHEGFIKKFNK